MAEFVEFRTEEWLGELEQMERIHLFETTEVKTIAAKRREFEYKIQRRTKVKEDYLNYIQFEVDLHRLIKGRRQKTGIDKKVREIEFAQIERISKLFKAVIFRFENDIKLWMSFFKFCNDVKYHILAGKMLARMLQIHSKNADLWVFAANWEFGHCKSLENARRFLTKGLRHHPSSSALYSELFKLELEHIKACKKEKQKKIEKDNWIDDEVTDNIIKGKIVEIVYNSAVSNILDCDMKIVLLNIAKKYKDTEFIQSKIIEDLLKYHPDEEVTWDAVAKQALNGIFYDINQLTGESEPMEIDEDPAAQKPCNKENKSLREKLLKSVEVYKKAVEKLNTVKMWSLYLNHVKNINKKKKQLCSLKSKLLKNAFKDAYALDKMDEEYFLYWITLLQKSENINKVTEVLKRGTEIHPKSLKLWFKRLRFHLSLDEEEIGEMVFNEAVDKLPDCVEFWKLFIHYHKLKASSKLEDIFKNGMRQGGEVTQTLKPLYIDWVATSKGIEEARKVFESTEMQHPPYLQLYQKMADLELNQSKVCSKSVRRCHELACHNFGRNNPNVWIDYIKFEMTQRNVTQVSQIYRRGLKILTSKEADEFVIMYNNIKIKESV